MSALSPVTIAAAIGAPVTGLTWRSANALAIAATTCTVRASWGWNAEPHTSWSRSIIGSMRPGDSESMTWRSERWPR